MNFQPGIAWLFSCKFWGIRDVSRMAPIDNRKSPYAAGQKPAWSCDEKIGGVVSRNPLEVVARKPHGIVARKSLEIVEKN